MCGIYGELRLSASGRVGLYGEVATDSLTHRGPDARGIWHGDGVFLGMRRLSIIDLECGQQPIWNEDGRICIVYNGELYNFRELREQLEQRGHHFRTRSDTEVVVHAYEEWGQACLKRFNGMFAFAIWDDRSKKLLLARDRIGEKPLYYYSDGTRLLFGSEIKALLVDPSIPRRVNPIGLSNYLAFGHSVAPVTMLEGIRKVPAGHFLEVVSGDIKVVQYWDIGDDSQITGERPAREAILERLRELLDDSVRRRMVADVPVGAFLSGGLDSSAVAALMCRHATGRVKTFSLGFTVGGAYNELADARRVADFLGTEHHELHVEHVDLVETMRTLVYHFDEPFGDDAAFPMYLLSRFARGHVKVALSGDGGDELFGGYRRYAADQLALAYQSLPSSLIRGLVPGVAARLPRLRRIKKAVQTLPILDHGQRYANWLMVFTRDMREELLSASLWGAARDHEPSRAYQDYYSRLNPDVAVDHLNRLMYADFKVLLVDAYMEKLDKASMACGLEGRLPLLDYRLAELAFQIPGREKIRGWATKLIFKDAVRPLLPREVLKKRKHGFAVPIDPWFRGALRGFSADVLLDERTRRRGLFDMTYVERLWREHADGRHVWDSQLWLLLVFEMWNRIYVDGDGLETPTPSEVAA